MPKVSVIVPNFNHARYLNRRLEGILQQSFQDFEVIVLDDVSTDDSRKVIETYRSHPQVTQILYNETNSGIPFKQWNRGVKAARGEYIWIAETDDDAKPDLLKRLVAALDANPQAGLAYCQSVRIDGDGVEKGTCEDWTADIDAARWKADFTGPGPDECARALIIKNTIPNASAAVFRREIFERAGGAVTDMRLCGDWMTWVKMLLLADLAFVAEPMNYFRTHQSSVRSASKMTQLCAEEYRVKAFVLQHARVPAEIQRRAAADSWLRWHWCLGDAACRCDWGWQLRILPYVRRLGHPPVSTMLREYTRHRLSLSVVGRGIRAVKRACRGTSKS